MNVVVVRHNFLERERERERGGGGGEAGTGEVLRDMS